MEYKEATCVNLSPDRNDNEKNADGIGTGKDELTNIIKKAHELKCIDCNAIMIIEYITEKVGELATNEKECISTDEINDLIIYIKIFNIIFEISGFVERLYPVLSDIFCVYFKIVDIPDIMNDFRFILFQTISNFAKQTSGYNAQFFDFAKKVLEEQTIESPDENTLAFLCHVFCKNSNNDIVTINHLKYYIQILLRNDNTRSPYIFSLYIKLLTHFQEIQISEEELYEVIQLSILYEINKTSSELFADVCMFLANYLENNHEFDMITITKSNLLKMISKCHIHQFNCDVFKILEYFAFHSHHLKKKAQEITAENFTYERIH